MAGRDEPTVRVTDGTLTPPDACARCRWFVYGNFPCSRNGACRRHAPVPVQTARWPTVGEDDWCGDFEEKKPGWVPG